MVSEKSHSSLPKLCPLRDSPNKGKVQEVQFHILGGYCSFLP